MTDPKDLKEVNKLLLKYGLRLGDPRPLLDGWYVLYQLNSSEVIDGVSIKEWQRLMEIPKRVKQKEVNE